MEAPREGGATSPSLRHFLTTPDEPVPPPLPHYLSLASSLRRLPTSPPSPSHTPTPTPAGHISEAVGTHGAMKCRFDRPVNQADTICMPLWKRIFPRWGAAYAAPLAARRVAGAGGAGGAGMDEEEEDVEM
jgi:hypothetical protein